MAVLTIRRKPVPEPQPEEFRAVRRRLSARLAHLHVEAIPVRDCRGPRASLPRRCRRTPVASSSLNEDRRDRDPSMSAARPITGVRDRVNPPLTPMAGRAARTGRTVLIHAWRSCRGKPWPRARHARRTGDCSVMGCPASVAGQVVSALVIEGASDPRGWPAAARRPAAADCRHPWPRRCSAAGTSPALRGSVADIERMNSRPRSGERLPERGNQELPRFR